LPRLPRQAHPPPRGDRRKAREPSADLALLAGGALALGGLASVAPWEVGSVAFVVVALLRSARRVGTAAALAALLVAGLGAVRAHRSIEHHEGRAALADAALPAPVRCSAHGRVDSSPVRARDTLRYDAGLDTLSCEGASVPWTGMATLYGGPDDLARGDEVEIVATLAPPQRLWNPSGGDPRASEAHRGVERSGGAIDVRRVRRGRGLASSIDRVRALVRRRIDATFAPDLAPMARALVLGESDLAAEDDRAFRVSGLSHLLAVSGMHLVLVLGLALKTLEMALTRLQALAARADVGRIVAAVGVPLAWVYAEVAGAGGSTVRAAWMATAVLLARGLGRRTSAVRAFGISMAAMALLDPLVAFDLSFLLSAAATAGLLAFAGPLGDRMAGCVPHTAAAVARAMATTTAASVACAPILARFAPSFPLGGVVANLLAVPIGECAALPLCLVSALLPWWPAAERGSAVVASGALVVVRLIARAFSVPALTLDLPQPTSWQLAATAVLLASPWFAGAARRPLALGAGAAILLLEVAARRAGAPTGLLRATFLDVGQGDGVIVDLPDGKAW
jgi:competence protein ComEC